MKPEMHWLCSIGLAQAFLCDGIWRLKSILVHNFLQFRLSYASVVLVYSEIRKGASSWE
jgi:hypothetical protein